MLLDKVNSKDLVWDKKRNKKLEGFQKIKEVL